MGPTSAWFNFSLMDQWTNFWFNFSLMRPTLIWCDQHQTCSLGSLTHGCHGTACMKSNLINLAINRAESIPHMSTPYIPHSSVLWIFVVHGFVQIIHNNQTRRFTWYCYWVHVNSCMSLLLSYFVGHPPTRLTSFIAKNSGVVSACI